MNSQQTPPQQQSRSKQSGVTSPNVTTPPLRPGMGGPNSGYNTSPGLYGPNVPQNVPPNVPNFPQSLSQMNRSFNQEGSQSSRYGPMVPPHMGPPQPHVSSSTHPSNMDSLRGLLSHQNAQNFNPMGPNYNMGPHPSSQQNGPPTHAQAAAMQQMRNNYMNNGPGGPYGPTNGPNNAAMMQASMSNMQRLQMQRFMPPMRPPMMPNVSKVRRL